LSFFRPCVHAEKTLLFAANAGSAKDIAMKLALYLLLLLTLAGAAGAYPPPYDAQLAIDPPVPWEGVPVKLTFQTRCTVAHPAEPVLLKQGNTLRVEVLHGGGCISSWPPPEDDPFTVDAGLLAAGSYTVELWLHGPNIFGGDYRLEKSFPLTVLPEFEPQLQIDPPNPDSAHPISLHFQTWCTVSGLANPELVKQGNVLQVTADDIDGCLSVYPPLPDTPFEVKAGRLEAGSYTVELWLRRGAPGDEELIATFPITVTPAIARLRNGRFELNATWTTAAGETGPAELVQETSDDSALFYFFNRSNWELMVKVLDGCAINGHYWVFAAASTDVKYDVTVKDLATSRTYAFGNQLGVPAAAINRIDAFSCD
jgi:hypothetical protein